MNKQAKLYKDHADRLATQLCFAIIMLQNIAKGETYHPVVYHDAVHKMEHAVDRYQSEM